MSHASPIPAVLDPPTRTRYVVLAWLCAAAAIVYVQRTMIGVAAPKMQSDLGLTEPQMGAVMSAFFCAYALFQIPGGWFGHHAGSRAALAVYVGLASVLCGVMALSGGLGFRGVVLALPLPDATRTWAAATPAALFDLLVVWFLVGGAIAGIFPCCANTFAHWFPETGRGLPSGFLSSAMSVGGIVATLLTGYLLGLAERGAADSTTSWTQSFTWRTLFVLYAIPGGVWALWFFGWFRNRPADHPAVNAAELEVIGPRADEADGRGPAVVPPVSLVRSMFNLRMSLIYGQQFFRAAGYVFYQTWFPKYLKERYGVSTEESGYLTSLPLVGVVLGGFVGGPLVDAILRRTGSRRLSWQAIGAASQFICGAMLLAASAITDPLAAVLVIALGSFLFAFANCCTAAVTIELAGPHVATVYSAMNMSGNVGALLSPLVVPWLVQATGWESVLLMFAGVYFAAGLCWAALNLQGKAVDVPAC